MVVLCSSLTAAALLVAPTEASGAASASTAADPVALVNPFIGTGFGAGQIGAIGTFPGADVPFGMVQWSPDTPSTSNTLAVSGGYYYTLDTIDGFGLTHLSGAGCTALEDFPVIPFAGNVTQSPYADPTAFESTFSHKTESASPGYYAVTLSNGVKVELTVTNRTGIGRFTFPPGVTPSILVDPEATQATFSKGQLSVTGDDSLSGSATAGKFCDTTGTYTAHFVADFDSPFHAEGAWEAGTLSPGATQSTGTSPGIYATFAPAAHGPTTVTMKVGLSYSSTADASLNLRAEEHGFNFDAVHKAAAAAWEQNLSRIKVSGGSDSQRTVFYTALYHALLFPSILSDDNGDYPGLDGHVHVTKGNPQYTNISGWDIYRSEVPLLTLLEPRVSDGLVASMVRDAAQDGGFLPRWEFVNVSTNTMGGDSADPIIAGAYAFGARDYDAKQALAAMVHGADTPATSPPPAAHGYVERPGLAGYLADGYVPTDSANLGGDTSSVTTDSASVTLEYAEDDFAISQMAQALGEHSIAKEFAARAQNWRNVFDSTTHEAAPKGANGALPTGWPTGSLTLANKLGAAGITGVGQIGFQEGDAAQYSWMVPQDLSGLFTAMGGRNPATTDLENYLSQLEAGSSAPFDWAGNEPDLGAPFVGDYSGAPWLTEKTTTTILRDFYPDEPVGEPGNDDLGAMSSWAVWSMIGLYPETPGTSVLATTSPTFTSVVVDVGHGRHLAIHAMRAKPGATYISSMTVNGHPSQRPWLPGSMATGGGDIAFKLVGSPDKQWGSAPQDSPPSYGS
jgi:predicted alpha-1,2-mannosidase